MEKEINNIHVPVLLIGFNRPEIIRQSFEYIRAAAPQKLYVAIDGARKQVEGEDQLVNKVRKIVQNVDWQCETHYRFNTENRGAEVNVSKAISWVLEKEEYVIILEDDIIAPVSFFNFVQEMLIRYKNEERVGLVSGCNFTPMPEYDGPDYFFTKYGHTGGWGTWRRVWKCFNLYATVHDKHLKTEFLKTICYNKKEINFYKRKFSAIQKKRPGESSWDNIANYIFWVNHFINIVPKVNLTTNIGTYGLHAKGMTEIHFITFDETFNVSRHPDQIIPNIKYDIYHFNNHIYKGRSTLAKLKDRIHSFMLK